MIEVENLSKRYGPTLAVSGVSFNVQKGEVLGFLGPNGAGKTTTMRVITGFLPPTEGKVRVAGTMWRRNPWKRSGAPAIFRNLLLSIRT